jgi:tetratricopeptide (TPR) repeat protein
MLNPEKSFKIEKGKEKIFEKEKIFIENIKKEINEILNSFSRETFNKVKRKSTGIFVSSPDGELQFFPNRELYLKKIKEQKWFQKLSKERQEWFIKKYEEIPIPPEIESTQTIKDRLKKQTWFKNLTPEEQKRIESEIEFKIANYIHRSVKKTYDKLTEEFLEKEVKDEKVRNLFDEEKCLEIMASELSPQEKEEVYQVIEKFKEYFGFYPGDPATLKKNCAGFRHLSALLYHLYGIEGKIIFSGNHTLNLIRIGGKTYASDVVFNILIPFSQYFKKTTKYVLPKIYGLHAEFVEDSILLNNTAWFYARLGKLSKAEELLREAIKINPDYAEAHVNLGSLLVSLERYDEAEKEYREAIKINPDYAGAHFRLGELYVKLLELRRIKADQADKIIDEGRKEILEAKKLFEKQKKIDISNIGGIYACQDLLIILEYFRNYYKFLSR